MIDNNNNPIDSNQGSDWLKRHRSFLAVLTLVIIGAGLLVQYKIDYYRKNLKIDLPVHQPITASETYKYDYSLEEIKTGNWPYDKQFARTEKKTGQIEVLISSIRAASGIPDNHSLLLLSVTDSHAHFIEILPDSDAPPFGLYSYDFTGETLAKHKLSPLYTGLGNKVLSPDGESVAIMTEGSEKVTLVKLDEAVAVEVGDLSSNETLNYCITNCFGGFYGELVWLDNSTVEAGVFDSTKTEPDPQTGLERRALIEKRTYQIN